MTYLRGGLLLTLLTAALAAQAPTSSQAFQSLVQEYNAALEAFRKASQAAETPEARQKTFREKHPHPSVWAPRFMDFHRRYATSHQAVEALGWVVAHPVEQTSRETRLRPRALQLLQTEYIKDERLGRICTGLIFTIDEPSEQFLRAVFSKAPSPGARARACASLAHNFKYRARLIRSLKQDPETLDEYEKNFGKPILAALMKQDPDTLVGESKKLFQYVVARHADIKHPTHGTLGAMAKTHLATLEKPILTDEPAPEIEGTDIDGKPLKLSDHRGKVVLLDFWGNNFPSSQAMYGYERGLAKRLAGKPFVILGVSSDSDREAVKKLMEKEQLAWRSWWDGGHVGGPIATRWEVDSWPTLYLIDHKGVVRNVSLGWPKAKTADEAIDALIAEAVKDRK